MTPSPINIWDSSWCQVTILRGCQVLSLPWGRPSSWPPPCLPPKCPWKRQLRVKVGKRFYKKWREDLRRHQLHVLPLTFWLYVIHARLLHSFFRATLAGRLKLGLWWECCPLTRAATQHYIRDWSIAQDWWQLEGPTSLGNWKDSVYQTRIVFIDCSTSHWLPSLVWGRNNWCILCPNRFLTLLPHESPSTKVHPREAFGVSSLQ